MCLCVSVYYQCLLGRSCRSGGECLSPSQWCDDVKDCPHGEDESLCCKTIKSTHTGSIFSLTIHVSDHFGDWTFIFLSRTVRLHGTDFLLQRFSSENQAWMPVCAENWNINHGRSVCEHMGYKRLSSPLFVSVRWLDCLIFRYLINYGKQMWYQWCAFTRIFSGWPAGGSVRLKKCPYLSPVFCPTMYIVYCFIC